MLYLQTVTNGARMVALFLAPVVLLLVILWQLFKMWIFWERPAPGFGGEPPNGKPPKPPRDKTQALERYLRITEKPLFWIRDAIDATVIFFERHRLYIRLLLLIWLLNLNVFTLLGSTLAMYFYFVSSFDFAAILTLLARTLMDILIMLNGAPAVFWIFMGWRWLCYAREKQGYKNLQSMEQKDGAFVGRLPILVLADGWMGAGKNLLTGSIKITAAIRFRQNALDGMLDIDLHFPHFPWEALWRDLRREIESGRIYNPTPAERWVQRCHVRFHLDPCPENIWGYDIDRYPMDFNDDLQIENIWDALEDYAKLFFIYFVNTSICLANYSMREDFVCDDLGHLPMWDTDLFHRDPRRQELESRYCHILDFDMLRLGKKMVHDNKFTGALEIGVINITEVGKERGNQDSLRELKKMVETCNPLNDGLEDDLKMRRHPAVIRNKAYILILTDEQRAMSWKANGREIALLAHIKSRSETVLALPFFTWAEMAYDFFRPRYDAILREYYHARGDTCLPIYLLKTVFCFFFARHIRTVNRFGYQVQEVAIESGTQDGAKQTVPYYIILKKDLSRRYETNCLKGIYQPKLAASRTGLIHIPEYRRLMAEADELAGLHSHFIENYHSLNGE